MKPGKIRIIGGKFRGRLLKVPDLHLLRPTPDRVRETIFNWLANIIVGARCLDAFAGSGALGFEALSRGAVKVVMLDASFQVIALLKEAWHRFKEDGDVLIYQGIFPEQFNKKDGPFDIVFLDPPYEDNNLLKYCVFLEENALLANNAYIYLECRRDHPSLSLPSNWQLIKSKKAGQVAYHLAQRQIKSVKEPYGTK